MKRLLVVMTSLFVSVALSGQQIPDNHATIRAEYNFYYKRDSARQGDKYLSDIFYLDICNSGQSFFYGRNKQVRDSLKRALLSDGLTPAEVVEKTKVYPRGLSWYVNKRFLQKECDYGNQMISRVFCAGFPLEVPGWRILQDTLTLNGYMCRKAVAVFMGREWNVWFTEQVAINDGPWLLWGLPGLILHASDSGGYFKFECIQVGKLPVPYPVLLPSDFMITQKMTLEQFLKAEKVFYEYPLDFPTIYLNVKRLGNEKMRKKKYIPLVVL